MNIWEIRSTMCEKGISEAIIGQFAFPASEEETPEEKVAFTEQMDRLLSKEQILSVMAEQGCNKNDPNPEWMQKFEGKSIEKRIEILNAMSRSEAAFYRLNGDGTLSILWDFEENGKYICVCSTINELKNPANVSLTYCGCCSGHIKFHSENFLGVKLCLIETVSSPIASNGKNYCEHLFEIC